MSTFALLEELATSLPEVTVEPHFDRISFRVRKKIFATYDEASHTANMKLSTSNQEFFGTANEHIFPVNNKWGEQGWTTVEISEISEVTMREVLHAAYREVAPKKLSDLI